MLGYINVLTYIKYIMTKANAILVHSCQFISFKFECVFIV